jgi:ferric-dicitrate binding protein FerR (iron transport regulator)
MATISAPHRGGHTARRSQLALVVATTAAVILAAIVVALLAHGGGSSGSGIQGSGIAATQTRTVAGFSRLELAGSNDVTVVVGARSQSLSVRTAT